MSRPSLSPSIEALVVVDLQRAFPVPPRIIDDIRRCSRRFTCRVFTRFVNPKGSLFRKRLKIESCPPGSPDTALLLNPTEGDVVLTKNGYGFTAHHIRRLKRLGIARATVCGVDTDACVLGVMFSLFDAGIDCRVEPDLCWSSTGLHREGLEIMAKQFPPPKRRVS